MNQFVNNYVFEATRTFLNQFSVPVFKIFPDKENQEKSEFPRDGVSIISKPQGHLLVAHQHREKWILAGFVYEVINLDEFSRNWKGCSIVLFENKELY